MSTIGVDRVDRVDVAEVRLRGLRANSFAACFILLIEYGLGIWVNLYGNLPKSDHGTKIAKGFGHAVADGPVGLSIHALLGIVLMVSAGTALVRAMMLGRPVFIVATVIGLVAIVVAAVSGASFVGNMRAAASMSMAMSTGVAILSYAVLLFVSGTTARARA